MSELLEVKNISLSYGAKNVIRDVSFSLSPGQIIAVIGSNGAGKTTLLKSLNGSIEPDAGTVLLKGDAIASLSRRQIAQQISVVAQENETKFPVTALEFVLSGRFAHGGVFGWESEDDIATARNALKMCDLEEHSGRLMNELSGGERQRVVFARALATRATILLLDEPTANLDLSHQAILFRLVRERCKSCLGASVIVTHDLNLAAEFSDEILLLKNGSVIAKGAPHDVLTADNLRLVFDADVIVDGHPTSGKPRITMSYI